MDDRTERGRSIPASFFKTATDAASGSPSSRASEPDVLERLHAVSTRLIRQENPVLLLEDILDAALDIAEADCGTLQMLDPDSRQLRITAHRGLDAPFLDFFMLVSPDTATSSALAWKRRERVLVEDVVGSTVFRAEDSLPAMLGAGIRSTVATPLISRDGRVMGVMSTHWREECRPGNRVLRLLDLLARQAADAIERARSEEALRRSEERFRGLFDQSPLGAAVIAPDLRFLRVNKAYADITGYSEDELSSMTFPGFTHPDDVGRDLADVDRLKEGKADRYEKEERFIRKDGRIIWVRVSVQGIRDEAGRLLYFLPLVEDITTRKRMEESLRHSLRRLELLAATAGELLRAPKPQEAVESLCRRLMEYLGCDVFFNFLADEKAGKLRLNAWAGIPAGEAHRLEWQEYDSSICGCAALEGCRIVAEHILSIRDERTELVRSFGVKAYACHPLLGPMGKVIGTLSFGTRDRNTFSEEELSMMAAVTDHVAIAMTRMKDGEALRASLLEKDDLLRELSHRTKNNMQVVVSLLELQRAKSWDARLEDALSNAQDRIRAMALVHEKLYRSGSYSSLNMKEYLKDLVASLLRAHQGNGSAVRPLLELDEIEISLDAALPCGLIINELVSNSLKHAFRDRREGSIFMTLRRCGKDVEMRYGDDGPGLPPEPEFSRAQSLGLKLVHSLAVRQLRGKVELANPAGSEFVFRFPCGPERRRTWPEKC